jgi:hypothetical protein
MSPVPPVTKICIVFSHHPVSRIRVIHETYTLYE